MKPVSKGGFKAFRGSAATAENYLLERDSDRLDDYYREGKSVLSSTASSASPAPKWVRSRPSSSG